MGPYYHKIINKFTSKVVITVLPKFYPDKSSVLISIALNYHETAQANIHNDIIKLFLLSVVKPLILVNQLLPWFEREDVLKNKEVMK